MIINKIQSSVYFKGPAGDDWYNPQPKKVNRHDRTPSDYRTNTHHMTYSNADLSYLAQKNGTGILDDLEKLVIAEDKAKFKDVSQAIKDSMAPEKKF